MTELHISDAQAVQWNDLIMPVAQLLKAQPVRPQASVLWMLNVPGAVQMLRQAIAQAGFQGVEVPADAHPPVLEAMMVLHPPAVVVCAPQVFGWVSKQAFLANCSAVFTCGESGEGTLLDRAKHFG